MKGFDLVRLFQDQAFYPGIRVSAEAQLNFSSPTIDLTHCGFAM